MNSDNVKIHKAYAFRLYPTRVQETALNATLHTLRLVYNSLLNERKFLYETTGKGLPKNRAWAGVKNRGTIGARLLVCQEIQRAHAPLPQCPNCSKTGQKRTKPDMDTNPDGEQRW